MSWELQLQVGEVKYQQIRWHILKRRELLVTKQPETVLPAQGLAPPAASSEAAHTNNQLTLQPNTTPSVPPQSELPTEDSDPLLCRSMRQRRWPECITKYIPSWLGTVSLLSICVLKYPDKFFHSVFCFSFVCLLCKRGVSWLLLYCACITCVMSHF